MEKPARYNLADDVRRRLEEEINDGRLMPGDALDERQLAKRFEVSRTPIREAIHQLAAQGLVRAIPRQGVYVARMSIKELLAMFELQAELEGLCARFAARRMTTDQRQALAAIYARCKESAENRDIRRYAQENADFHETIYRGSHNRYLAEQARTIRRRTEIYRQNTFQREGRIPASLEEHGKVLEAILRGDDAEACVAMRDHISVGGTGFAEFISTLPDEMLESHEQAYPIARAPSPGASADGAPAAKRPAAKKTGTRRPKAVAYKNGALV
ncbi:MAG TPA: GntR family transcriptional regulator [Bordetella sp.]